MPSLYDQSMQYQNPGQFGNKTGGDNSSYGQLGGMAGLGGMIGGPVGAGIGGAVDLAAGLFGGGGGGTDEYNSAAQDMNIYNEQGGLSNMNQNVQGYGGQQGWGSNQGYNNQQGNNFQNTNQNMNQATTGGGSQTGFANTIGLTNQQGTGSQSGVTGTTGSTTQGGTGAQQNQLRGFDAQEQAAYNAIGGAIPGLVGQLTPEAQAAYGQQITDAQRRAGLDQVNQSFNQQAAAQKAAMARTGTGPGSIMNAQAAQLAGQKGLAANQVESNAILAGQNAMNQRAAANQNAFGALGGQMTGMQGSRQVVGTTNQFDTTGTQSQLQRNNTTNQFNTTEGSRQGTQTGQDYNNFQNTNQNTNTGTRGGFSNTGQTGEQSQYGNEYTNNQNTNQTNANIGYGLTAQDSIRGGFQPNFFGDRLAGLGDRWSGLTGEGGPNMNPPQTNAMFNPWQGETPPSFAGTVPGGMSQPYGGGQAYQAGPQAFGGQAQMAPVAQQQAPVQQNAQVQNQQPPIQQPFIGGFGNVVPPSGNGMIRPPLYG